jgi:uncharacterized protein
VIDVREFKGPEAGACLLVFGAIHGNEVCGPRALLRIAEEIKSGQLKLLKGRLRLVPVCNQKAFDEKKRYIEENLNRVFEVSPSATSHERKLAHQLAPLLKDCDYFLDLHSMQAEGEAFVVLNQDLPESDAFGRALGLQWILKGWPDLYKNFPEKPSRCTQDYADLLGKPNALIECGSNGAPEADQVAYECTLRALSHLGILGPEHVAPPRKSKSLRLTDLYFRDSAQDSFLKVWENFEPVQAKMVIGHRADGKPVLSPRDGYIVFPSSASAVGTEWFYIATAES